MLNVLCFRHLNFFFSLVPFFAGHSNSFLFLLLVISFRSESSTKYFLYACIFHLTGDHIYAYVRQHWAGEKMEWRHNTPRIASYVEDSFIFIHKINHPINNSDCLYDGMENDVQWRSLLFISLLFMKWSVVWAAQCAFLLARQSIGDSVQPTIYDTIFF